MTDAELTELIALNRKAAADHSGGGEGCRLRTGVMILAALKARGGEFTLPDGKTALVATDGLGVLWSGWLEGGGNDASPHDLYRARNRNDRRYGQVWRNRRTTA